MKPKIKVGTSGWNYADWKGAFYPVSLKKSEWFDYYQQHFPIVEINATFYHLFPDSVFIKWKKNAKAKFHYIIKIPRVITHRHLLKNCTRAIKKFDRTVDLLGNKLALVLLQLPPNMVYDLKRLKKALLTFKDPKRVVVEFRDPKWYTSETYSLLKELGCIFCAADSPKTPLQDWVTSRIAYIRLHGRTTWFNYCYTSSQLKKIAELAKRMTKQGAKEVYILFNNDYYSYAVKNVKTLMKCINH